MKYEAENVLEYVELLPLERKMAIQKLRKIISANLPKGFIEQMSYGMIGYVIPLTLYPPGYHVKKNEPLPFLALASQKNYIALYHMGLYQNPKLLAWFVQTYKNNITTKLDMAKSCIRFKNIEHIPYELIGDLCTKMTPEEYIEIYEASLKQKHRN